MVAFSFDACGLSFEKKNGDIPLSSILNALRGEGSVQSFGRMFVFAETAQGTRARFSRGLFFLLRFSGLELSNNRSVFVEVCFFSHNGGAVPETAHHLMIGGRFSRTCRAPKIQPKYWL